MNSRSSTVMLAFALLASGCQCASSTLVRSYDPNNPDGGGAGNGAGGGAVVAAGGSGGGSAAGGTGGGAPAGTWCASDCDCPSGTTCVSSTSELTGNTCVPGAGVCATPCATHCPSGTQCIQGTCAAQPCVGTNCTSSSTISVQGTYFTYYELDISQFAQDASDIAGLLDLLAAALSPNPNCGAQTTPVGKLICIVVSQNIHAPAWVQQLLTLLSGAFKFGDTPIRAKGVMQLAENTQGQLFAAENWTEMWMNYNGQVLNVMNNPQLGLNGNITVTVKAFGGTRSATEVFLGPRSIEFDVNKLLVNLINIAITAASNNQAHDVGELLDLVLCSQIPVTNSNYLVCTAAAQQLAQNFQLDSGLGGIDISQQRATIFDLDGNGVADALGTPTSHGSVAGDMSNGIVSDPLGAFPKSWWYGTK